MSMRELTLAALILLKMHGVAAAQLSAGGLSGGTTGGLSSELNSGILGRSELGSLQLRIAASNASICGREYASHREYGQWLVCRIAGPSLPSTRDCLISERYRLGAYGSSDTLGANWNRHMYCWGASNRFCVGGICQQPQYGARPTGNYPSLGVNYSLPPYGGTPPPSRTYPSLGAGGGGGKKGR